MSQENANSQKGSNNVNQFNKFLNNNTDFLNQKYLLYYKAPFPFSDLVLPSNIDKTLKFIYDIFSFSKYEKDQKLNQTLRKSLTTNIISFVNLTTKKAQKNAILSFDNTESVKLLKYCIQNNDMFAVKYDKKKKTEKEENVTQNLKNEIKDQIDEQKNQYLQVSAPNNLPQVQVKENDVEQVNEEAKKVDQVEQNITKELEKQIEESQNGNQFAEEEPKLEQNHTLIKKQLKQVFQFYCKQQQNVGPNSTFDNIDHKCKTMTIGKFVAFSNASNLAYAKQKIYSESKIDKNTLISTFKKLAQGKKQIDFKIFLQIIEQLKKYDQNLIQRLGLGQVGSKGKKKIQEKLKYFSLPFNTRDPLGRQISPHGRLFVPKLTSHSGKIQQSLREQLASRKQREKSQVSQGTRLSTYKKKILNSPDQNNQKTKLTFKLGKQQNDRLEQGDLSFLSNLITHQENDELFLKDYKIPSVKKNIQSQKQRVSLKSFDDVNNGRYTKHQLEKNLEQRFGKNAGALTSRPNQRQDLILPEIKRRIKEFQPTHETNSIQLSKKKERKSFIG